MRIEVSDTELDYLYRLMLTRPMGEVEPLVVKLRIQISRQQQVPAGGPQTNEAPAGMPEGAQGAPNGAGGDWDSLSSS